MDEKRSPSELEAAVEAACEEYYDKNAKWCILGIPLDDDDKSRVLDIMKAMYMSWLEQYNPGQFVRALLNNDLAESVNRADDLNVRCLKLYVWFKYNEMRKSILFKNYDN